MKLKRSLLLAILSIVLAPSCRTIGRDGFGGEVSKLAYPKPDWKTYDIDRVSDIRLDGEYLILVTESTVDLPGLKACARQRFDRKPTASHELRAEYFSDPVVDECDPGRGQSIVSSIFPIAKGEVPFPPLDKILNFNGVFPPDISDIRLEIYDPTSLSSEEYIPGPFDVALVSSDIQMLALRTADQVQLHRIWLSQYSAKIRKIRSEEEPLTAAWTPVRVRSANFGSGILFTLRQGRYWVAFRPDVLPGKMVQMRSRIDWMHGPKTNRTPRYEYCPLYGPACILDIASIPLRILMILYWLLNKPYP